MLDVYVDTKGKVWLVDFNPFIETTDSLLFSWDELHRLKDAENELKEIHCTERVKNVSCRVLESQNAMKPAQYMGYGLPKDLIDPSACSNPTKTADIIGMMKEQSLEEENLQNKDKSS